VPPRYLLGPVSAEFAADHLADLRRSGDCLAFGPGGPDLTVGPSDAWGDVLAKLPDGWSPDFVALWLGYSAVPAGLWSAGVPLVGLAPDWTLLWHQYRHQLPACDLVLTDTPGVEALHRAGVAPARSAVLYGAARPFVGEPAGWPARDIDVLFVGNLHPAVHGERLPWLARLAGLAGRWTVRIAQGVFGEDYRSLLRRARVVFNRSTRGEANRRLFEAAASGALVLQETGNREAPALLRDREECAYYADGDLEQLLEHFLLHEDERAAVAARGRERVLREGTFDALWQKAVATVEAELGPCRQRTERRLAAGAGPGWRARLWQRLGGAGVEGLEADLRRAAAAAPDDPALHRALGLLAPNPGAAAACFGQALACDPRDLVAGLSRAEALLAAGQPGAAAEAARHALAALEGGPGGDADLDLSPYPGGFDALRVGWEAAAWRHPDGRAAEADSKRALLRGRLHALLADLTGGLGHYYEAALARPDLPPARAALGCALARAGRAGEAVPHLRAAMVGNPFDRAAARALYQALRDAGRTQEQRDFARDRRLLHAAAPQAVPAEPWFAGAPQPAPAGPDARLGGGGLVPPDVPGWFDFADVYDAAVERAPRSGARFVEVGAWLGRSTIYLARRIAASGKDVELTAVDTFRGSPAEEAHRAVVAAHGGSVRPRFEANLRRHGVRDRVAVLEAPSVEAAASFPDGSLDFVFIDADHAYKSVKADVRAWLPKVRPGGVLAGHDYDAAGVARAVREELPAGAVRAVGARCWSYGKPGGPAGLASLVILCCDELAATRVCLESVLRHTRPSYELVLVDNGSSDGTAEYLAEIQRRPGPLRVEVIRNAENLGFPKGANQGIAAARGEYAVLLNNDTAVTPGWLDGLVGWALVEGPPVGLVGPVSNYAPAPQHQPAGYGDLSGLDAFATAHRARHAGQALRVERLTGFCLLIRREVLARVGALDEGYGAGFFEDDDLCVRAREAGYRLLVARDVYVHHEGSRTFKGQGIDTAAALQANFRRFRDKWGEERAAGYRLPAAPAANGAAPAPVSADTPLAVPAAPPSRPSGRPRVSLTMIVKNEEANLPDCLRGLGDLFDEIVVVDTGSTDGTKAVAESLGATVYEFPWVDSFAAARNAALGHATGQWAFWLDADDRLDDANRARLQALLGSLPGHDAAFVVKCRCVPSEPGGTATVVDHVRLVRLGPSVRWEYRVHEQLLPSLRRAGYDVRFTDVTVDHVGYTDPALRGKKLERDLRLLHLEDAERPGEPFTLFNLGSVYHELGRPAEAVPLLQKSIERSHPRDSIVRKLYALVAQCHRQLRQPQEALAACAEGRGHYPDDAELLFVEALARRETGDAAGAEVCLRRLIDGSEGEHFASVDAGLRGHKARHNLAVLLLEQGRRAEAEAQWRSALTGEPAFRPARVGLAELYLEAKDWPALEQALGELAGVAPAEAAALKARGHLARQEFGAARWTLAEAIEAHPKALLPRVVLTHVLLQEGRDWAAAERALRDVLALDPGHAEARRNLAVLHSRHGVRVDTPQAG
jgi:GT2 family glycosyltransferase/predicted O-methyltransferase YrrM/predicted Zn-dependent protease